MSPPVKRLNRYTEKERVFQTDNTFNQHQHDRLLRDFRTTLTKQNPVFERPDGPSSTSLILKRTTEKEVCSKSFIDWIHLRNCFNFFILCSKDKLANGH